MKMFVVRCSDAGFLCDSSFDRLRSKIVSLKNGRSRYWVPVSVFEEFGFQVEDDACVDVYSIPMDNGQTEIILEALKRSLVINDGGHGNFCVFTK